jgi:hypothetical protein
MKYQEKDISREDGNPNRESDRPSVLSFSFNKSLAAVEVCLPPDPRLVVTAHLWFYLMDTTDVALPCHAAQEWANRDVLTGVRITHLNRNDVPEIFRKESNTIYHCTIFHKRHKPTEDIRPSLLNPDIYIRNCWRNTGTEDTAAESALLARFIFHCPFIH